MRKHQEKEDVMIPRESLVGDHGIDTVVLRPAQATKGTVAVDKCITIVTTTKVIITITEAVDFIKIETVAGTTTTITTTTTGAAAIVADGTIGTKGGTETKIGETKDTGTVTAAKDLAREVVATVVHQAPMTDVVDLQLEINRRKGVVQKT